MRWTAVVLAGLGATLSAAVAPSSTDAETSFGTSSPQTSLGTSSLRTSSPEDDAVDPSTGRPVADLDDDDRDHADGAALFARQWVPADPRSHGGDGQGPVANDASCAACHLQGGLGGAGPAEKNANVLVTSLGSVRPQPPGRPEATLFGLLSGVGTMDVSFDEEAMMPVGSIQTALGQRGAGDAIVRAVADTQRATPSRPAFRSSRNPTSLFGDGLIDRVPDDAIVAAASVSYADWPSVSGTVPRDADGRVARFGWKGTTSHLSAFVANACANELGLDVPGAAQRNADGDEAPSAGVDLVPSELGALTAYVAALPAPVQMDTPGVREGEAVFDRVGCAACHAADTGGVPGLYSDLLLHDLGSSLADGAGTYGSPPVAADREWRTPPLWGVASSAPYLHDGRAATLEAAIQAHGGEADPSRKAWAALSDDDRARMGVFLRSLVAPVVATMPAGAPVGS